MRAAARPERANPTTKNGPSGSGGRICFGGGTLMEGSSWLALSNLLGSRRPTPVHNDAPDLTWDGWSP
jgi:hypothetical protein